MLCFVESVLLLNILQLFLASQILGVGLFFACQVVFLFVCHLFFKYSSVYKMNNFKNLPVNTLYMIDCLIGG